jgi:hypothetical protein
VTKQVTMRWLIPCCLLLQAIIIIHHIILLYSNHVILSFFVYIAINQVCEFLCVFARPEPTSGVLADKPLNPVVSPAWLVSLLFPTWLVGRNESNCKLPQRYPHQFQRESDSRTPYLSLVSSLTLPPNLTNSRNQHQPPECSSWWAARARERAHSAAS